MLSVIDGKVRQKTMSGTNRLQPVLQKSAKQSSGLSAWLAQLTTRTHRNLAAVAQANKLARMAWAVLAKKCALSAPDVSRCGDDLTGLQMTRG